MGKFQGNQFQFFFIAVLTALVVFIMGVYLIQAPSPNLHRLAKSDPSFNSPVPTTKSVVTSLDGLNTSSSSSVSQNSNSPSRRSYGHFSYSQVEPNQLMIIASYGAREYQRFESLDPEAGRALMRMIYTARDEGVWIVPASAFRTIERQKKLFQQQVERRGSVEEAAKFSAPPGYSEHHTGFAIDLADGKFPKGDISTEFAITDAYNWLIDHAVEFGFELSFPADNLQGVSYEPWHWRYIGSSKAQEVFKDKRR